MCVCVFSCVPLISGDLMDEDGRCPSDYQSRQMKAEAGRQLAGVFYQTHLKWIPTVSVCVVLYVSICLRLLKTGAASCFTEREYFSFTDIWPVWSFTHTHTRPSLCISWPLQWVMTGVDCIRVQHRAANTHICGWWSERTHRKKNHFWCDELGLIQCPRRWKGSDLLVSVKRPTLQFNSMATYLLALIQPF